MFWILCSPKTSVSRQSFLLWQNMTANYNKQRACMYALKSRCIIPWIASSRHLTCLRAVAMLHNCRLHTCHRSCNLPIYTLTDYWMMLHHQYQTIVLSALYQTRFYFNRATAELQRFSSSTIRTCARTTCYTNHPPWCSSSLSEFSAFGSVSFWLDLCVSTVGGWQSLLAFFLLRVVDFCWESLVWTLPPSPPPPAHLYHPHPHSPHPLHTQRLPSSQTSLPHSRSWFQTNDYSL